MINEARCVAMTRRCVPFQRRILINPQPLHSNFPLSLSPDPAHLKHTSDPISRSRTLCVGFGRSSGRELVQSPVAFPALRVLASDDEAGDLTNIPFDILAEPRGDEEKVLDSDVPNAVYGA